MINKNLKYFCKQCKGIRPTFIAMILNDEGTKQIEQEIFKSFTLKDGKEFKARKLHCQHWVSVQEIGIADLNSEVLSEIETTELRQRIDKEMIGKTFEECIQQVMFQAEQYQTLLKIAEKKKQQAAYALQLVSQLKLSLIHI